MLTMTTFSSSSARRLVLVPAPSPRERPLAPGVRRFRVAHLRLDWR